MKHSLSTKILVVTLSLLLGSVAVAAADRAFSATGRGVAVPFFDDAGRPVGATVTGTGNATHLGSFTSIGKIAFTPDPRDPNIVLISGEAVFTAAGGDKLNVVIADGSQDTRTGVGTGHFSFNGGTGRFANATGITEFVVEQNFVTGAYEITIVGQINF